MAPLPADPSARAGLRASGFCPSRDEAIDRMLRALEEQVESETDPARRTKLRAILASLRDGGRAVVIDVASAMINRRLAADQEPAMAWEGWLRCEPVVTVSTSGQVFVLQLLTVGSAVTGVVTAFLPAAQVPLPWQSLSPLQAPPPARRRQIRYRSLRRRTERQFRDTLTPRPATHELDGDLPA